MAVAYVRSYEHDMQLVSNVQARVIASETAQAPTGNVAATMP